jgi:soluble lytic murein transglycosylase
LIDQGDYKLAYRVAANHQAQSAADIADAEFHAGWYALRFLKSPKTAEAHFLRIEQVADGAISRARGYYWMGRAAEAGGGGDAKKFYEEAARYPTAFYGQLAMAKLGRSTAQIAYPEPTDTDRARFARRVEVAAIQHLEAAGDGRRATPFYYDLAYKLKSSGELALLAVMAEDRGDNHLSLKVGKVAASRGLDIGALAHPLGAIPSNADISGSGKALAYAIARQESEFNTGAVSGAGARGLLQLMPGTARKMARKAGISYAPGKLTNDAAYNATLGATYLDEQLQRFDGSYVLTFAGYNAGPNRAAEWVDRYGDPRGKPVDEVVDWIERIPYTETRNYVQRVMENYQVYKMRIKGHMDIAKDLVAGR